jgi:hypothetical protein
MTEKGIYKERKRDCKVTKEALPDARVSLERHFDVLKTLKDGKIKNYKEIGNILNINEQLVSGALKFFHKLNFLVFESKKGYKIEDNKITEFLEELSWKTDETEIIKKFRECISDSWFVNHLKEIYLIKSSILKEELKINLGKKAGADPEYHGHNKALNRIIEFLKYGEFICPDEKDKTKYIININKNGKQEKINEIGNKHDKIDVENKEVKNEESKEELNRLSKIDEWEKFSQEEVYFFTLKGKDLNFSQKISKKFHIKIIKNYLEEIEKNLED